jgi:hypothetical protein
MEQLEYLIRTLTYKRSCLELEFKKLSLEDKRKCGEYQGKIDGLSIAITEIYKLVAELDK